MIKVALPDMIQAPPSFICACDITGTYEGVALALQLHFHHFDKSSKSCQFLSLTNGLACQYSVLFSFYALFFLLPSKSNTDFSIFCFFKYIWLPWFIYDTLCYTKT